MSAATTLPQTTSQVALNGTSALRGTIIIPRCGIWTADLECANTLDITKGSPATVNLVDQVLEGTVIDGGPYATRGWYRIVGGKGGLRNRLKPKSYRSAAGVKLSTIMNDVASETGETLATFTDTRIGPAYMRPPSLDGDGMAVEAARVLDALVPSSWYVETDGSVHLGAVRPPTPFTGSYRLLDENPALRRVTIAADSLSGLLPGAQLEGIEIATVRHELTDKTFRTHLYGTMGANVLDRAWRAIARIVRALTMGFTYAGRFEYQITGGSGGYLDLSPINPALGLPTIGNCPVRVGAMGARGTPATNCTALVGFLNLDPSKPFVDGFLGEAGGDASIPTESDIFTAAMKLGDSTAAFLAHSTQVGSDFSALSTFAGAVTTFSMALTAYTAGIKAIVEPLGPPYPLTAAIALADGNLATAAGVLQSAIAGNATALPTTIVKGT